LRDLAVLVLVRRGEASRNHGRGLRLVLRDLAVVIGIERLERRGLRSGGLRRFGLRERSSRQQRSRGNDDG
jgi:hypothetical protein